MSTNHQNFSHPTLCRSGACALTLLLPLACFSADGRAEDTFGSLSGAEETTGEDSGSGDSSESTDEGTTDGETTDEGTTDEGTTDEGTTDDPPEDPHPYAEFPTPTLVDTLIEMPDAGHFNQLTRSVPLSAPIWTGEYFTVPTPSCHPGSETRGLWVFTRDGALVGERDVCLDALAQGENSDHLWLETHQWSVGYVQHVLGPTTILREAAPTSSGHSYPLMIHEIGPSSVALTARDFEVLTDIDAPSQPPEVYNIHSSPRVLGTGVVGDLMYGFDSRNQTRVIYSLPDMTKLSESPGTPLFAYFAVGDYLYAKSFGIADVGLYALDETSLELVTDLSDLPHLYLTREQLGARVVGRYSDHHVRVYELVDAELVETVDHDLNWLGDPMGISPQLAVTGELVFYGGRMIHAGVEVPLPPLPDAKDANGTPYAQTWYSGNVGVRGMAFGDDGTVMVTTAYGAYLYDFYPDD